MRHALLIYIAVISVVGMGIFGILQLGNRVTAPASTQTAVATSGSHGPTAHPSTAADSVFQQVGASLKQSANDSLSRLFLQILVIVIAARSSGWLFHRFGQPAVVGEMVAGILLGPSLFGLLAPDLFQFVFPASSMGALKLFSQIGVCLFMFTVGMELDISQLRNKAHVAVVVSHASIIIPCFFGVVLALFLYGGFAQPGATFTAFALFMGISMSITAFPVLARILQDRGIFKTPLGSAATACAAVDDVTAWSMLAFVVAIVRAASVGVAVVTLGLVLVFVAFMWILVRPNLPRLLGEASLQKPEPDKGTLAAVVAIVLACALSTELMGIHALFGSFLAGVIMPDIGGFRHKLGVRIENFSSVLLLPLFFAFTGLRTHLNLLNDAGGLIICVVVITVATAGKLGGSAITARLTGMPWRESLQLGALMNTRGLMELIALNIGYDLGILSQRIFAMLVIMALVTTLMTGPLLTLFAKKETVRDQFPQPQLS